MRAELAALTPLGLIAFALADGGPIDEEFGAADAVLLVLQEAGYVIVPQDKWARLCEAELRRVNGGEA